MIVTCPDYRDMPLAELRAEYLRWEALLARTVAGDARKAVRNCRAVVATWIARKEREREAAEMAA